MKYAEINVDNDRIIDLLKSFGTCIWTDLKLEVI